MDRINTVREYKTPHTTLIINDRKGYMISKRLLDIFGAVIGLLILLPLMLIVAIIIKIEDPIEPIFFKQKRVGINGEEFFMFKYRSMVSNAEELLQSLLEKNEASGPLFKIKNDPRVTRIGKIIRKTSIDELPQLWNVLKGDMSLVGPRPALPREVDQYMDHHRQRLKVTPGLTCLWQVNGRSNLGFEDQVVLDLKYIMERNLVMDLKLIIKTVFVLFGSKDAF